jgi:1,4-alpha-glucan branching enzyme
VAYDNFRSGVLCPGTYTEIFNSNTAEYGGYGVVNAQPIEAEKIEWDFKEYSIQYNVPSYGVCVFKFDYVKPEPKVLLKVVKDEKEEVEKEELPEKVKTKTK